MVWAVPTASTNECVPRVGLGARVGTGDTVCLLRREQLSGPRGILVLRETYGL